MYSGLSPSSPMPSSSRSYPSVSVPSCSSRSHGGDEPFILHPVSNLDTLAGLAIRYGVEVADIKRANGLVTDIQMFGHQILRIPKPGRAFLLQKTHGSIVLSPDGSSMEKRSLPSSSHVQSSNNNHKGTRTLSLATMNFFRGLTSSSSTWQTTSDEGMEMTCYNSDGCVHDSDIHVHASRTEASPIMTMEDERCVLWNRRITGIKEDEEFPKPHNVYTPMVMSVFNSVVDAEKNFEKTSMGRASKIDEDNQANGSKIAIREAIFNPARGVQKSTKNRTNTSDRTSGNRSLGDSVSLLPQLSGSKLFDKEALASSANVEDILPANVI